MFMQYTFDFELSVNPNMATVRIYEFINDLPRGKEFGGPKPLGRLIALYFIKDKPYRGVTVSGDDMPRRVFVVDLPAIQDKSPEIASIGEAAYALMDELREMYTQSIQSAFQKVFD